MCSFLQTPASTSMYIMDGRFIALRRISGMFSLAKLLQKNKNGWRHSSKFFIIEIKLFYHVTDYFVVLQ